MLFSVVGLLCLGCAQPDPWATIKARDPDLAETVERHVRINAAIAECQYGPEWKERFESYSLFYSRKARTDLRSRGENFRRVAEVCIIVEARHDPEYRDILLDELDEILGAR